MYWVHLIQDKVNYGDFVNTVMNLRVALSMGNFFTSLASVSVPRRAHLVEVIYMFHKIFVLLAVEEPLDVLLRLGHRVALATLTPIIETKKYQLNVDRTININYDSDIKLTSVNTYRHRPLMSSLMRVT